MKKVLITGASGLLGCNLVREMHQQDYAVRILVRPNTDLSLLPGCEVVYGHIDKKEDVMQAVGGCDIVVHAAALTGQWNVKYEEYERVNITATKYMAEAVLQHAIERFIFVSSAGTLHPKPWSDYIQTKYLAEQYLLTQPLPVIIVQPSFMIGAYDSKPSSGQLILYALNKRVLFYPPGGKNFVHVRDVCLGIIRVIHFGQIKATYLLGNRNMTYRDFYKMLFRQTGHAPLMIRIPRFVLKIGGWFGSLFGGKLNATTAHLISSKTYCSTDNKLPFSYTPIEEAIGDALAWFKKK